MFTNTRGLLLLLMMMMTLWDGMNIKRIFCSSKINYIPEQRTNNQHERKKENKKRRKAFTHSAWITLTFFVELFFTKNVTHPSTLNANA